MLKVSFVVVPFASLYKQQGFEGLGFVEIRSYVNRNVKTQGHFFPGLPHNDRKVANRTTSLWGEKEAGRKRNPKGTLLAERSDVFLGCFGSS